MKQHTTLEQTVKLIELGFEKPTMKNIPTPDGEVNEEWYSIGELIEMLPQHIFPDGMCLDLHICSNQHLWVVKYTMIFRDTCYRFCLKELVDALYDMILRLKEEGMA